MIYRSFLDLAMASNAGNEIGGLIFPLLQRSRRLIRLRDA